MSRTQTSSKTTFVFNVPTIAYFSHFTPLRILHLSQMIVSLRPRMHQVILHQTLSCHVPTPYGYTGGPTANHRTVRPRPDNGVPPVTLNTSTSVSQRSCLSIPASYRWSPFLWYVWTMIQTMSLIGGRGHRRFKIQYTPITNGRTEKKTRRKLKEKSLSKVFWTL